MAYCFRCGAELEERRHDGRNRLACPACSWVHYPQLKVGAAAQVVKDGNLLLLRRSRDPWQGCWYLPAGYVEADENPAAAAERELFEEAGLIATACSLVGTYYFDDDPRGNGILLVYDYLVTSGSLAINDEADAVGFFDPTSLPEQLTGAGHKPAIEDWVFRQKAGQKP
ncbi:MAG: NUDIX domain-containing protein [Bellilinea sp.]